MGTSHEFHLVEGALSPSRKSLVTSMPHLREWAYLTGRHYGSLQGSYLGKIMDDCSPLIVCTELRSTVKATQ